jgi:hypothetical protein
LPPPFFDTRDAAGCHAYCFAADAAASPRRFTLRHMLFRYFIFTLMLIRHFTPPPISFHFIYFRHHFEAFS